LSYTRSKSEILGLGDIRRAYRAGAGV